MAYKIEIPSKPFFWAVDYFFLIAVTLNVFLSENYYMVLNLFVLFSVLVCALT